jgi:hypothetical protein
MPLCTPAFYFGAAVPLDRGNPPRLFARLYSLTTTCFFEDLLGVDDFMGSQYATPFRFGHPHTNFLYCPSLAVLLFFLFFNDFVYLIMQIIFLFTLLGRYVNSRLTPTYSVTLFLAILD